MHPQDALHQHSLRNPESFWTQHAQSLHWHKPPSRALHRTTKTVKSSSPSSSPSSSSPVVVSHDHWTWFPDGEISTTYNCIDRHVARGRGNNVAIVWESPVTGVREEYTYRQLLDEVEVLAGVLREEGVRRGDVVIIYSMSHTLALFFFLSLFPLCGHEY